MTIRKLKTNLKFDGVDHNLWRLSKDLPTDFFNFFRFELIDVGSRLDLIGMFSFAILL